MGVETTKQKILTEALKLFSQNGYEAVSVEQIANAVGIKAPSLYKHYKGENQAEIVQRYGAKTLSSFLPQMQDRVRD